MLEFTRIIIGEFNHDLSFALFRVKILQWKEQSRSLRALSFDVLLSYLYCIENWLHALEGSFRERASVVDETLQLALVDFSDQVTYAVGHISRVIKQEEASNTRRFS